MAPLALEAMDAVMWVARLLDARVQIDATFSGNDTLAADIRCEAGHAKAHASDAIHSRGRASGGVSVGMCTV